MYNAIKGAFLQKFLQRIKRILKKNFEKTIKTSKQT